MAKRIADRRFKREKKNRITKTEEYLINSKYIGDEPTYTGEVLTDAQLTKAYNWYNYMCRASDARDYIVEYMERIGKKKVARLVKSIPDGQTPTTAGWLCRILLRGGKITDRSKEFLLDRVTRAIERNQHAAADEKSDDKPPRQPTDVQAAVRERARDIIGQIEHMIDLGQEFSLYEFMQRGPIPAIYSSYIASYYQKMVDELTEVLTGQDTDLKYAYRNYSKPKVKKMLEFYTQLVDEADQYAQNAARVRKANRKPKTISVEKMISRLKFKNNDQEYKLVSIDPQQILAAQELWTFNTKNRMLTVYRAQDQGGLGVKTVRITGYNESTSISKRLRKPESVLQSVLSGGKPTLRTVMDNITTKPGGFSSRITTDTILLRVVR